MTKHRILLLAAAALPALAAPPAAAQVLASSSFTAGDEGWRNGDFDAVGGTSAVIFNPSGTISVPDGYNSNALVAPTAYLGDKSAAFGGVLRFDLASLTADGPAYSPVALLGAGLRLFANFAAPPAPTLTPYSVTLVGASFFTGGDAFFAQGPAATDDQLRAVLASLDRLAIQGDWQTGSDLVTLDNVVLSGPDAEAAVPEPSTWGALVLGMGLAGGALRRRRARVAFA